MEQSLWWSYAMSGNWNYKDAFTYLQVMITITESIGKCADKLDIHSMLLQQCRVIEQLATAYGYSWAEERQIRQPNADITPFPEQDKLLKEIDPL